MVAVVCEGAICKVYIQYPKVLVPLPELDISFDTMRIESGIQFLFVKARCAYFSPNGSARENTRSRPLCHRLFSFDSQVFTPLI